MGMVLITFMFWCFWTFTFIVAGLKPQRRLRTPAGRGRQCHATSPFVVAVLPGFPSAWPSGRRATHFSRRWAERRDGRAAERRRSQAGRRGGAPGGRGRWFAGLPPTPVARNQWRAFPTHCCHYCNCKFITTNCILSYVITSNYFGAITSNYYKIDLVTTQYYILRLYYFFITTSLLPGYYKLHFKLCHYFELLR
jgi:hypothetical protein